jgi:hypothetical protein
MTTFHYGKAPATADPRDLKFSRYRTAAALPAVPQQWGYDNVVAHGDWGMLGNDQWGDCVWAGAAHEHILTSTVAGAPVAFDDEGVLADYSASTGFDPNAGPPGQNPTDKGTNVRSSLGYRRATGIADAAGRRHKITAYLQLDVARIQGGDFGEVAEAAYLFGAVGIGIQVPQSAETEFSAHEMWSYVAGSPKAGGHYVPIVAHRKHIECVTWGRVQPMGDGFVSHYVDEAWAILNPDFLNVQGENPAGFDMAQLQADLAALGD